MQNNIRCLLAACQQLGIDYTALDTDQHCVRIQLAGQWHYFTANRTPFNPESLANICLDKQHTYDILHPYIQMPLTRHFLDPHTSPQYQCYLKYRSLTAILKAIAETFDYPVVIKPNRGALGINVTLCHDESQVEQALQQIFDHDSRRYDYIAIAQHYIPPHQEYRLVCFRGEPVLLYQRCNTEDSTFNVRYWETGYSLHIEDKTCLTELATFAQPIFDTLAIPYVGLDILRGLDGQLYLLELNSAPRYDHFIEQHGDEAVIAVYRKLLQTFASANMQL